MGIDLGSQCYIFILIGKGTFNKTIEPHRISANETNIGLFSPMFVSLTPGCLKAKLGSRCLSGGMERTVIFELDSNSASDSYQLHDVG